MKPLKLEMNAFAAFYKNTVIDFTHLNSEGIYLVTGDTGAGKTTIFDAMTFALYGEASGEVRKKDGFRSDFASKTDKTYVIFTFEHQGVIYTIERTPDYMVEGRATAIASTAKLSSNQGLVVEKTKAVNQKVEEILKINVNQFRQIIMLAQGEFQKLILADSKERDEIFRKIFGTNFLKEMSDRLAEKTKVEYLILNNININIGRSLQDLLKYYEFDIDNYLNNKKEIENLIDSIDQTNKEDKKELKKLVEEYDKLNNELQDINTLVSTAKSINDAFDELDKNNKTKNELEKQKAEMDNSKTELTNLLKLQDVKEDYDAINNLKDNIKKSNAKIKSNNDQLDKVNNECLPYDEQANMIEIDREAVKELKEYIDSLNDVKQAFVDLDKLENNEKDINSKKQALNVQHQELKAKYDDNKAEYDSLPQLNIQLVELKVELDKSVKEADELEKSKENLESIKNDYKEYKKSEDKLNKTNELYQASYNNYLKIDAEYKSLEKDYYNQIIGNLALDLKDDTPCPVCGSIHHPNPAACCDGVVSSDDLKNKQGESKKAFDAQQKLLVELEKIKNKLEGQLASIFKALKIDDASIIKDTLDKCKKEIDDSIKQNDIAYKDIKSKYDALEKEINEISNLETKLKDDNKSLEEIIKECGKLDLELAKLSANKDLLKDTIGNYQTVDEVNEDIESSNYQYETLDNAVKTFDKDYSKLKSKKESLKAVIDSHNSDLEKYEEELKKKSNDYNVKINGLDLPKEVIDNIDSYFKKINKISQLQKDITNYDNAVKTTNESIERLNKQLDGKTYQNYDDLKDKQGKLNNEFNTCSESVNELKMQTKSTDDTLEKLNQEFIDWTKQNQKYTDLLAMKDIASGNNVKHLSFERYILAQYFDNILIYANLRFRRMTDGRYDFRRKIELSKGNGQQGLDMEIFDAETGKERDVKTLSGGEIFKAALSLALGLADAIESSVGGIEIDALFIDEGFGSLDVQSLRNTMDILNELRGDNKVIGIISHVEGLADLIPAKLSVKKGDVGSVININI